MAVKLLPKQKLHTFLTKFEDLTLKGTTIAPTSHVRMVAML